MCDTWFICRSRIFASCVWHFDRACYTQTTLRGVLYDLVKHACIISSYHIIGRWLTCDKVPEGRQNDFTKIRLHIYRVPAQITLQPARLSSYIRVYILLCTANNPAGIIVCLGFFNINDELRPWIMDVFLVLLGCKWYGMVYHSSLVPFPPVLVYTAAVHVLFRFLPSRRFLWPVSLPRARLEENELLVMLCEHKIIIIIMAHRIGPAFQFLLLIL